MRVHVGTTSATLATLAGPTIGQPMMQHLTYIGYYERDIVGHLLFIRAYASTKQLRCA